MHANITGVCSEGSCLIRVLTRIPAAKRTIDAHTRATLWEGVPEPVISEATIANGLQTMKDRGKTTGNVNAVISFLMTISQVI